MYYHYFILASAEGWWITQKSITSCEGEGDLAYLDNVQIRAIFFLLKVSLIHELPSKFTIFPRASTTDSRMRSPVWPRPSRHARRPPPQSPGWSPALPSPPSCAHQSSNSRPSSPMDAENGTATNHRETDAKLKLEDLIDQVRMLI